MIYDLIIVGSGAAGLSAGIYAGRYRLKTLIIGEKFGGETAIAGKVENYPGLKSVDGYGLMKRMKEQAESFGAEIIDAKITKIEKRDNFFIAQAGGNLYQSKTIIFAVGAERRYLNLPNEKELTGRGVHYCATCDGPVYTGKTIAIVGGGDNAVKGAILAAEYANKIFMLVMEKEIIAEPINYEQLKKLGNKVEILFETQAKEIVGVDKLEKLILTKPYKNSDELVVDGLFIEIGYVPGAELAEPLGVELDEHGYVKVDNMMKTNVPGVFAAGDATHYFGRFKQIITAAAMGAVAATSAYEYCKIDKIIE